MFKLPTEKTGRREFIRGSGRAVAGGGLVLMAAIFGSRKEDPRTADPCHLSLPCQGCRQLSGCKKEQAAVYRKEQSNSINKGVIPSGR